MTLEETSNHELNKWDQGDDNWEHSTDMQTIEERLVVRDTESNLSNYTPHSGATFIATDTGAVYDGDGSSWNKATRDVDTLSAERVLRGNAYRNPKPSEGTAGIQKAVKEVGEAGGGVVHLNVGEYIVNNGAQFPASAVLVKSGWDNVAIIGEGYGSVIKVPDNYTPTDQGQKVIDVGEDSYDTGNDQVDSNVASGPHTEPANNCLLANFRIDGNWRNNTPITEADDGHNIELKGSDCIVTNVWSHGATGDGVELTSYDDPSDTRRNVIADNSFYDVWEQHIHHHGDWHTTVSGNVCDTEQNNKSLSMFSDHTDVKNITITGNVFRNSQVDGVELCNSADGGWTARDVTFTGNVVEGHSGVGIVSKPDAQDITIANNVVRNNGKAGIQLRDAPGITVEGNHIYGNSWAGIYAPSQSGETTDDLSIHNNSIFENGQDGIALNGGTNVSVQGNQIYRNQYHGIGLTDGSGTAVDTMLIAHNQIVDNNQTGGSKSGIFVGKSNSVNWTRLFVRGNVVVSTGSPLHGTGINFSGSGGGTTTNAVVAENYVEGVSSSLYSFGTIQPAYVMENRPRKPVDVRQLKAESGNEAYHDGTNGNTVGPAFWDGSAGTWKSVVDGTTIS